MPVCPYCEKEINYLEFEEDFSYLKIRCIFVINENGEPDYRDEAWVDCKLDDVAYRCPRCGEKLFDNQCEAVAFLKGEAERDEC
ncbi:hypothetical protein J7L00_05245 [Candidatus Bathyarchaeota archaeon]|nr:hypothetical protein [Candidatus Bathyarchaeota archaeon]